MAKKVTQWRPDTCGCVLHYEWDDEVPVDERVHTPVVVDGLSLTCKAHQAALGAENVTDRGDGRVLTKRGEHQTLHAQVLTENQGKNRAHARILERMSHLTEDDGVGGKRLKPEHELSFSFDKNRKLTMKVKGVPDAQVRAALAD